MNAKGGDNVPASKAQIRATNKYISNNYDSLRIVVPKGRKQAIEAHAKAKGESVNGLVNALLRDDMGLTIDEWGGNEEMKSVSQIRRTLNNNGYSLVKRDRGEDSWMIVKANINGVAAGGDNGMTLDEVRDWMKEML